MNLNDLLERRIVLQVPEIVRQRVLQDIIYKSVDGIDLKMDIYYPTDFQNDYPLPAVVFVHGEAPWELVASAKDWGQYTSWGQIVASSGLAAITFTHRSSNGFTSLPEVSRDVDDLLAFVRDHAEEYSLEQEKLGLWACSAGGPVGLSHVLRDKPQFVRCVVAYYPLLNLQHIKEIQPLVEKEVLREFSPINYIEKNDESLPPLLIAKAGLDRPKFNDSIDEFVRKALQFNLNIEVLNHPDGHHGFEIMDDNPRSKEIIKKTLQFFHTHLRTS